MNIGENIKRIRLEKGWKQSDLAEKSNISRVAIGNYERGDRMPNIEILNKIAEALNVTLDDLYKVNKTLSKKLVDELEYPILKTYGPKDTLEILSTELEIEYSLLDDCLNNDKDLPIDALVKLLEFLCKIDFPLFMKFTEENKSALSDDITLKDAVSEIMAIKLITLENNSFDLFKKYLLLNYGNKLDEFIDDDKIEILKEDVDKFLEFALYKMEQEYYGEDIEDED